MKFLEKINTQMQLLEADAETPGIEPVDATAPATDASATASDAGVAPVAPEGYVDLVKLIAKATAMNFPAGALDEIFRTEITAENAFPMQQALEAAIKQNEMYSDNPERLQNVHYKQFTDSINPGNFIKKYKTLISTLKKQDPYIKDANI
ncbi:hypothetical protein UFOVP760_188 [uncultured Caudovirales phage]|uniref:Uncharacterized protein n=1 Tax=uncultured Caudovirales phage TaxID=2100421 RepID=A0A6J7X707_9CAUD|nr:hypothetical protein UFOVP760_188 [uncultured Caudovirales phage]